MGSEGEVGVEVELDLLAGGFTAPLAVVEAPDDTGRLFVVDQPGQVWIVHPNGDRAAQPFLDIADRILDLEPSYDERGLLGMAFHLDYAENGRFFVYYSGPATADAPDGWDHTSYISEFAASDDPDLADPESEIVVMMVHQPYHNHNGGQIAVGPDGFLYVPLGDGGNGGDRDDEGDDRGRPDAGWAQTPDSLLGSILRLDIDSGDQGYSIPADNPFVDNDDVADEIFAYGFRNPYGMSFDLETGEMYVADAGQALFEEVSLVEAGGNYGWNIREGTHCFDPDDFLNPPPSCPETGPLGEPLIDPVIEYRRAPDVGSVIIPGVLARDPSVPSLDGKFVFGDYASIRFIPTGILYSATPAEDGLWDMAELRVRSSSLPTVEGLGTFLLGVNQDRSGTLYVLTTRLGGPEGDTGEVFTIAAVSGEAESPVRIAVFAGLGVLALTLVALWVARRTRSGPGMSP